MKVDSKRCFGAGSVKTIKVGFQIVKSAGSIRWPDDDKLKKKNDYSWKAENSRAGSNYWGVQASAILHWLTPLTAFSTTIGTSHKPGNLLFGLGHGVVWQSCRQGPNKLYKFKSEKV